MCKINLRLLNDADSPSMLHIMYMVESNGRFAEFSGDINFFINKNNKILLYSNPLINGVHELEQYIKLKSSSFLYSDLTPQGNKPLSHENIELEYPDEEYEYYDEEEDE